MVCVHTYSESDNTLLRYGRLFSGGHLEKLQTAISQRRIIRSTSCLFLGWGFWGRRIQRRHFRLDQIQDGSRRPSWKTSNSHISAMHYPFHCMYVCTPYFARSF